MVHIILLCFCVFFGPKWQRHSPVMGATVAMERSIEFHLLDFYTLCCSIVYFFCINKYMFLYSKYYSCLEHMETQGNTRKHKEHKENLETSQTQK